LNRKQILDDAANAVLRDRSSTHGAPENSFGDIAKLWSVFLDRKIEPWQVAMMLGLLKVARAKSNPANADNFIDMAGYAACGGELAKPDGLAAPSLGRTPNFIAVFYGSPAKGHVICSDEVDIERNGVVPYQLRLDNVDNQEEAIRQGYEFLKSKCVLINV